jgi:hypothetical protein
MAVVKISNAILKKCGESGQHCLIPDFKKKMLSVFPIMMLAMGCCT